MNAVFQVGVKIVAQGGAIISRHMVKGPRDGDLSLVRSICRGTDGCSVAGRIVKVAFESIESEHDIVEVAILVGRDKREQGRSKVHNACCHVATDKRIDMYFCFVAGCSKAFDIGHAASSDVRMRCANCRSAICVNATASLLLTYSLGYSSQLPNFCNRCKTSCERHCALVCWMSAALGI